MRWFLKRIYALIPFKKWLFIPVKYCISVPQRVHRHLHFVDTISIPIPGRTTRFRMNHLGYQLENDLFWKGLDGYEERESLRWWIRLCEHAEVIVDAGANTGLFSLVAKSVNPRSLVYAFEPIERIHRRLRENAELNHYDIRCIPLALSDYRGEGWYFDTMTDHLYSATVNRNIQAADTYGERKPLKTTTLDDFVREERLGRLDLIKIDVETHEPEVLLGFAVNLRNLLPDMIIEVLNQEVATRLGDILSPLAYLFYDLDEVNGVKRVPGLMRPSFRNVLVCKESTAQRLGLASGPTSS
jgi:FkbM family methyltransferase